MDTDHQPDEYSSPSSKATSPPPSIFSFPTLSHNNDHSHELLQIHGKFEDDCTFDSPDSFAFFPDTIKDIMTEQVMDLSDFCWPIFKRKFDVPESEKALAENFSKTISLSVIRTAAAAKKKAMSMDDISFQTFVLSLSPKTPTYLHHTSQDDCNIHQSTREESEEAIADHNKVSPAAKFLLLMPRELSHWAPAAPLKKESTLSEVISDHHRHHHYLSYMSPIKLKEQNSLSAGSLYQKETAKSDSVNAADQRPQDSCVSQYNNYSSRDDRNDPLSEAKVLSSPAATMPSDFVLNSVAGIAFADSAPAGVSIRQHLSSESSFHSRLNGQMTPGFHDRYPQEKETFRSMVSIWLGRCSAKHMRKLQQRANLWASKLTAYYKSTHRQPSSASIARMPQRSTQLEDPNKLKWRGSTKQKPSRTVQKRDLHAYAFENSCAQLNLPSMKLWRWQVRPRRWAKIPRKWIMRRIRTSYTVLVSTYKAIRKAMYWRKHRQWQLKSSIHSKTPYQSLYHLLKPTKP